MKPLLITAALLLINLAVFAQSLEQSFVQLMNEYRKSPKEYAQNYYSDDYRFLGYRGGKIVGKKEMNLALVSLKVAELNYSDLKFYESGNLGVVNGIITIKYGVNTYKDAFTYTFQKQKDQWKNVAGHHTQVEYDQPNKNADNLTKFKTYFEESRLRFIENPVKFFDNECTADSQYITSKGGITGLKPLRDSFVPKKVLQREMTDLVFRPYGDEVMVVTGKMTHKYQNIDTKALTDYGTETITYTYAKDKSGGKLASAHHSKAN